MKVINIDGVSLVVELDWEVLSGDQKVKDVMARHKGVRFGILVEQGLFRAVGLAQSGSKLPKAPSGAALLALANHSAEDERAEKSGGSSQSGEESNWILVEPVGNNQYWLVVLKDGLPLPGTDYVASLQDVLELVTTDLIEHSSNFIVYSTDEEVRSQVSMRCQAVDKGFKDLIAAHGIKSSKGQLKQVAGIPSLAITGIVALLVVVSLWAGYEYLIKKQLDAARAAALAAKTAQEEQERKAASSKYAAEVQKAILNALEEGEKAVEKRLSSAPPAQVANSWVRAVMTLPLAEGGWIFTGASCTATPTVSTGPSNGKPVLEALACDLQLARTKLGTNRTLSRARPDAVLNGDKADLSLPLPPLAQRPSIWSRIQSPESISLGLISNLQLLSSSGVDYKNEESKEIQQAVSLPPPPKSIFKAGQAQPAPTAAPVKMGVAVGKLTLAGTGLWQLADASRVVNTPYISALDIHFTPGSSGQGDTGGTAWGWTMTLEYLVRTAPRPTLPTVVLPENEVVTVAIPPELEKRLGEPGAAQAPRP